MTLDQLSQRFKALSDPIRVRILHLLLQEESFCVCDLVEILQLKQSTVSRHLAYLKNAGLVESWREGVWMHYSVCQDSLGFLNLEQLETLFAQIHEIAQDRITLNGYQKKICAPCPFNR